MKFRVNMAAVRFWQPVSLLLTHKRGKRSAPEEARRNQEISCRRPDGAESDPVVAQEIQGQIDGLKSDLATKDAQLKQAQQAAAERRRQRPRRKQTSTSQAAGNKQNAAAVTTLQSTVSDLKANALSLATTLSDETSTIKKAISSPDAFTTKASPLAGRQLYGG